VANKFTFQLGSDDRRRPLPHKILIGQQVNEGVRHVALKFLAWVLFYRERLLIETDVQNDAIPFVPDLVELGYDMRPRLWVECGECSPAKLHKLAVKCPDAEIWVVKRSPADAEALLELMVREEYRTGRYGLVGLEPEMFDEVCGLVRERNTFHWFRGGFDPAQLQFELNGLWFDAPFTVLRH
jgi:hypothetical protein